MSQIVEELFNLVKEQLDNQCPVLSGNMKSSVNAGNISPNEMTIIIDPKFYDVAEFKETGNIVFTGAIGDVESYAVWVNEIGAFGKRNKSMHWANRVLNDIATSLAPKWNAKVINKLDLS